MPLIRCSIRPHVARCWWVSGRSKHRVLAGGSERKLVKITLSDHDDAGGLEPCEHRCI